MSIQVQTTHNVVIDYETAHVLKRMSAYLIDWVIIIAWFLLWIFVLAPSFVWSFWEEDFGATWIIPLLLLAPPTMYDLLFEAFNSGQTPGKMLIRIRVVRLDGSSPAFSDYFLRWLFRLIDFTISYGMLGLIMAAASKNGQRLGDMLAGTTVIDLRVNKASRSLSIKDLDFTDEYKLTYPNVINLLNDRDIQTILGILNSKSSDNKDVFLERLSERVERTTGYTYNKLNITAEIFLNTIVNDYHYLVVQ